MAVFASASREVVVELPLKVERNVPGVGMSDMAFSKLKQRNDRELVLLLQGLQYARVPGSAEMLIQFNPVLEKLTDKSKSNKTFFFVVCFVFLSFLLVFNCFMF